MRKSLAFLLSAAIGICNINVGTAIASDDGNGLLMVNHELTGDGMGALVRVEEAGPEIVITSVDMIGGEGTRVSADQLYASPSEAGQPTDLGMMVMKVSDGGDKETLAEEGKDEANRTDIQETENVTQEDAEREESQTEETSAEADLKESEGAAVEPEEETEAQKQQITRSRTEAPVVRTSGILFEETSEDGKPEKETPETEASESRIPESEMAETETSGSEESETETSGPEESETGKAESENPETENPEAEKPEIGEPDDGAEKLPGVSTPSEGEEATSSEAEKSTPSQAGTATPDNAADNTDDVQNGSLEYQEFAYYVNENGKYRFKVEYVTWKDVEVTRSNRKKLQKHVGADAELQEGDVVRKPVKKTAVLSYRIDDISGLYFEGLNKLEVHVGEPVDLMEGVKAEDESRSQVEELRVSDDGGFSIYEAGEYTVTYEAVHPVSGALYQAERHVSVLPPVRELAGNIRITSPDFGEGEGKTLEYLLGSGLNTNYNLNIEADVPEGTDRKITVTVPDIFQFTGVESSEADVSNHGSVCEYLIRDEVAGGETITLTGTFKQLKGEAAQFEKSVENQYRETGRTEFGSISAALTRDGVLAGLSEIGPLITQKPEKAYGDFTYLYGRAGVPTLWGRDLRLSYSGNVVEKCYLDGTLITEYRSSLEQYLENEMYNSGLVPYNVDSIEFYIPEGFEVYTDELADSGTLLSISELHSSDDSAFRWREKTETVTAVRYQCAGKTDAQVLADIGKIYVKPKSGVVLENSRYETYTSKKGILSSPLSGETIAVTDEDGSAGYQIYPHSYNLEALSADQGDYVLLRRMDSNVVSAIGGMTDMFDLRALGGKTLGKSITLSWDPQYMSIDGLECENDWTSIKVTYDNGMIRSFFPSGGFQQISVSYAKTKEIVISSAELGDSFHLKCTPVFWNGSVEGVSASMDVKIGETPNETLIEFPFNIFSSAQFRIVGTGDDLNIIEGDTLRIQNWEKAEIQQLVGSDWQPASSEVTKDFLKTIRAFQGETGVELNKAAANAGHYEVRYTAAKAMQFDSYVATAVRNLDVQSAIRLKEGGNTYHEEEGAKRKPVFSYTHYEGSANGREVNVDEEYIKPVGGGDGAFELTPGVHKGRYEITHPESKIESQEVTHGPGHRTTLEGSVVVDGKPEIEVQEREFRTIPGGTLRGLLGQDQVTAAYHYYEYKDGKIMEEAQKPAAVTLSDYDGTVITGDEYQAPLYPGTYYLTYEAAADDKVYVNGANKADPVRITVVVTNGVDIETNEEIYVSDVSDEERIKTKIDAKGIWNIGGNSGNLKKNQFQYTITKVNDTLYQAKVQGYYKVGGHRYESDIHTVTIHIRQLPALDIKDTNLRIHDTFDPHTGVQMTPDDGTNELSVIMPEGFNMDSPGNYEVTYRAWDPLLEEEVKQSGNVYIHGIPVIEAADREIYTHESVSKDMVIQAIKNGTGGGQTATPPNASVTYYVPAQGKTAEYPIDQNLDPIEYRIIGYQADTEGIFQVELTVNDKRTLRQVFGPTGFDKEAEVKKTITVTVRDKTYPVVFHSGEHGSYAGGDSTTIMAAHGKAPSIPWPNADEGYVVDYWTDGSGNRVGSMKEHQITGPEEFTAVYRKKTYTVRFIGRRDRIIKTQIVAHGDAAVAPTDDVEVKSNRFSGWSKNFDCVTSDLNVYVQFWTSHSGGPGKPGGSGSPGGPGVKNEDEFIPDPEVPLGIPQPQIVNLINPEVTPTPWNRKKSKKDAKNQGSGEQQTGRREVRADLVEQQDGSEEPGIEIGKSREAGSVLSAAWERGKKCAVHWLLLLVGALEFCYYLLLGRKKRREQDEHE